MITGYVKGRVETIVYYHHFGFIEHPGFITSRNLLKKHELMDKQYYQTEIPKEGDMIHVGDIKPMKVVGIEWISGSKINILTDYVIEVIEDDETKASHIKAQQDLDQWTEKIEEFRENRKKMWEPKIVPVEEPKKKGWFW